MTSKALLRDAHKDRKYHFLSKGEDTGERFRCKKAAYRDGPIANRSPFYTTVRHGAFVRACLLDAVRVREHVHAFFEH
ncbi:catalase [Anopheles sinensis]|uniref:Catalase n=1 Tax=Anopheles sinensis TaxID=74873 RepID=A0A084WL56_ANOSI|nr:catalase [Anopheles sinensis]